MEAVRSQEYLNLIKKKLFCQIIIFHSLLWITLLVLFLFFKKWGEYGLDEISLSKCSRSISLLQIDFTFDHLALHQSRQDGCFLQISQRRQKGYSTESVEWMVKMYPISSFLAQLQQAQIMQKSTLTWISSDNGK